MEILKTKKIKNKNKKQKGLMSFSQLLIEKKNNIFLNLRIFPSPFFFNFYVKSVDFISPHLPPHHHPLLFPS